MPEVIAETARLRLREWGEEDSEAFHAVMNTPAVMRYFGGVQTLEQWRDTYERLAGYQRDHGYAFWIVERREGGKMLGFCGLKDSERVPVSEKSAWTWPRATARR